ncbi:MAG TPA: vitamin K epoxide reductase family protein [bacterium]|nr:vitamin K epoxide reductase family protein [bacterium]
MTASRAIVGLSLLGFADALYMLAYHEGWIDHMWCPFFGEGCEIVGRSREARHAGVPNAAVGAAGYAGMAALAAAGGTGLPAVGLAAVSTGAAAASVALTWEMATRVRAWCFWCLLSAGINAAICALAWWNVSAGGRGPAKAYDKREGRPNRRTRAGRGA